jgi:hypothetical protein
MTTYKLSPSDFAYLYQECKKCFYLKIKGDIARPWAPFPGVFTTINGLLQGGLVGNDLKDLSKDLPKGKVIHQEGFVDSAVVPGTSVFIKGKYDLLVKNPDGTYTVVDLKITKPDEEKIENYQTQLWAYKYALENSKSGDPLKVTKLALLIFYPEEVEYEDGAAEIKFPPKWFEVPIDDKAFVKFMKEIDDLLKGPLPEADPECDWCKYRSSTPSM